MDARACCAVILMHVIAMFFFNSPDFIKEVPMPRAPRSVASMAAAAALATRTLQLHRSTRILQPVPNAWHTELKECARALHAHTNARYDKHSDTGTQICALTQVDTANKFEAALICVNMLVVATGLGLCIYCAVEDKFRYLGSDMYKQGRARACVCMQ